MSESKEALDLSYRPASYFWPITHETHAIGAHQRRTSPQCHGNPPTEVKV